jgi:hypothetical protein
VPLVAIVRDWSAAQPKTPVLLVYSPASGGLVFRDELLNIQAHEMDFLFIATTTRGPRQWPEDLDRRVDRALLRAVLTRWDAGARGLRAAPMCSSRQ